MFKKMIVVMGLAMAAVGMAPMSGASAQGVAVPVGPSFDVRTGRQVPRPAELGGPGVPGRGYGRPQYAPGRPQYAPGRPQYAPGHAYGRPHYAPPRRVYRDRYYGRPRHYAPPPRYYRY